MPPCTRRAVSCSTCVCGGWWSSTCVWGDALPSFLLNAWNQLQISETQYASGSFSKSQVNGFVYPGILHWTLSLVDHANWSYVWEGLNPNCRHVANAYEGQIQLFPGAYSGHFLFISWTVSPCNKERGEQKWSTHDKLLFRELTVGNKFSIIKKRNFILRGRGVGVWGWVGRRGGDILINFLKLYLFH